MPMKGLKRRSMIPVKKSRRKLTRGITLALLVGFFIAFLSTYIPPPFSRLNPLPVISLEILDRHGELLRQVLSDEAGRCRWVKLEEVSPYLVKATLAAEDRHFFTHPGISGSAVIRAVFQNLSQRRIVSGASTITQQLARNLSPGPRTFFTKLREAWLALRLEHYLSKKKILEEYLNRVFYGNQAYGVEAAARVYFSKSSAELSLAEAAFLASLPRSPSVINPLSSDEALQALKRRQHLIINRMVKLGWASEEEAHEALTQALNLKPDKAYFRAPHFCDWLLGNIPAESKTKLKTIRTTLDYGLQAKIETMLKKHLAWLADKEVTNGAVVVLENQSGDILSMVGSKDYFDPEEGQVNGAVSRRQPGSTLKPFTYALALEKGLTPASRLEDAAISFMTENGAYQPMNFDREFHGPVTLRQALACSYNVPAVSLASWVGPELLWRRLHQLGFESLEKSADFYGVGLTLGNGEVTLLELTRAYAALARSGVYQPERAILGVELKESVLTPGVSAFSPQVAYIITHILADRDARVPSFGYLTPLSFPFPVAVKTGTSEDFRDNWTIGFTSRYTVGVWVGNFNGRPMGNVSGITGSGPLFRDVILLLHSKEPPLPFSPPEGIIKVTICAESGELPSAFCPHTIEEIFVSGTEPKTICSKHSKSLTAAAGFTGKEAFLEKNSPSSAGRHDLEIIFPQNGDAFFVDPILRLENQSLKFRTAVSADAVSVSQFEWRLNGKKVGQTKHPSFFWNLKPGSYVLEVRAISAQKSLLSRPVNFKVIANFSAPARNFSETAPRRN